MRKKNSFTIHIETKNVFFFWLCYQTNGKQLSVYYSVMIALEWLLSTQEVRVALGNYLVGLLTFICS